MRFQSTQSTLETLGFFFVFVACFVYIRIRSSGQPQIMMLRAHVKSQNMLGILVLQLCYMVTCAAVDQQHCFNSHKDITKACGDGSNECICALQKVRCTQPSKCDSTLISKNQVCVNELNNDEDLWFANCGIYHDKDLTMTIVGWVLVFILSILIGLTMYKKNDDPDHAPMYFNAALAVFFAGVIIVAAVCFRDVFLVFMVSMVCFLFIIITSALLRMDFPDIETSKSSHVQYGTPEADSFNSPSNSDCGKNLFSKHR
jgi:heme A synthase